MTEGTLVNPVRGWEDTGSGPGTLWTQYSEETQLGDHREG